VRRRIGIVIFDIRTLPESTPRYCLFSPSQRELHCIAAKQRGLD
jgi:hypothetical protein